MGIPAATAQFLIEASERGVSFERTATLGRQHLMVGPWLLARMLRRAGRLPGGTQRLYRDLADDLWYADPLFHALGASEITTIDASEYEGSSFVWDLNHPIPEQLHERFSVVMDGGTLEHIFNAPTALRSCMEMVEVGGHLIVTAPANNLFGHGLYQFGPEFFFSAFSAENGFALERLLALPLDVDAPGRVLGTSVTVERRGPRYSVARPSDVGERVQLVNRRPVVLLVLARRTAKAEIFAKAPQQSDYARRWSDHAERAGIRSRTGTATRAERMLSPRARLHVLLDILPTLVPLFDPARRVRHARRRSLWNRRHFRRVRDGS